MEIFRAKSKEDLEKEIEENKNEPIEFFGKKRSFEEATAAFNYLMTNAEIKETTQNLFRILQGFGEQALIRLLMNVYYMGVDSAEKNREDQEPKTE